MYKAPEKYKIPNEVIEFQKDCDELGMIYDSETWFITSEWSEKFEMHFNKLLKLAETGEPWSQYNLGNIYFVGYLYTSVTEFEKNYLNDCAEGSKWLEKSAKQGFVSAVDNLVVSGIGTESDRLREISKKVEYDEPNHIEKWGKDERIPVIMPSFFERVWEIAYGKKDNQRQKQKQIKL